MQGEYLLLTKPKWIACDTKAEALEWDLGNLDSAAGQKWFHLLCCPEVTSLPCNSAPLSLLSPWYKTFWIRVVATMVSLTAHGSVTVRQKNNNFRALFGALPSRVVPQQTFTSGLVSIGPERLELWGALLLTLQEGTVCDPLPILTEGRGMLLGWQEALMVCRRGGKFQMEG